jgi:glycosyltransferase involved in cell wall biosynthesis
LSQAQRTEPALIPTLTGAVFLRGRTLFKASGKAAHLTEALEPVVRQAIAGGAALEELAQPAGMTPEALRSALEFTGAFSFVPVPEYDRHWDMVIVDQGATGVFVQTLELWRNLNRHGRVLLISLLPPPFPDHLLEQNADLRDRLLTFEDLTRRGLPRTHVSYYHLLRTLLSRASANLLLFTFRREATFFFDIIAHRPTVIYSDFYHEKKYALARQLFGDARPGAAESARLLEHLFFNIHLQFQGSTPANDLVRLQADWLAMGAARENWCWSAEEAEQMAQASGLPTVRFTGPAIDLDRLDRGGGGERQRQVLFVSTMPNFHRKGLVPLCQITPRLPEDVKLVLVSRVDLRDYFNKPDPRIVFRQGISKDEVIRLYHQSLCYVRVAEEDTLPYSLTEAMACRLPVIVSPQIQANFPGIEDGVTGFVVKPDDPGTLAEKLNYLLEQPAVRERMGEACRERVLEFSIDRRVEALEQLARATSQST